MSHSRIVEMLAESGLALEELPEVVDLLEPLDDLVGVAPVPSAELAALLGPERVTEARPTQLFGGRRGAVAGALVLALSGVGATGLSAAANTLPRPLQHRVSQFSHHYLPFDLPEPPASHRRAHGLPVLTPGSRPASDDHDGASLSRSIPGGDQREPTPTAAAQQHSHAAATPSAQPGATGSASPSAQAYAQPYAQPSSSGSPTPTDTPRDDPHDGKGRPGQGGGNPDKGKDGGTSPGTSPDKSPGKDAGKGKGGHGPEPDPSTPVPAASTPAAPTPAAPTLPLPDPLPDLGGGGGAGSIDVGSVDVD